MKARITELNHDELVDLISTAFTGNDSMGIDYDYDEWKALPEEKKTKDPCFEDKCADLLLCGHTITIADYEAEEYGLNGPKGKMVKNDGWGNCYADNVGIYEISYQDILEACSSEKGLPWATEMFVDENGDYWTGYNLIQIAMFGDIIYG